MHIDLLLRLQAARQTAPTDEEVAAAQAETLNSFVFNFASTASQLQRRLVYELIGLPPVRLHRKVLSSAAEGSASRFLTVPPPHRVSLTGSLRINGCHSGKSRQKHLGHFVAGIEKGFN